VAPNLYPLSCSDWLGKGVVRGKPYTIAHSHAKMDAPIVTAARVARLAERSADSSRRVSGVQLAASPPCPSDKLTPHPGGGSNRFALSLVMVPAWPSSEINRPGPAHSVWVRNRAQTKH
jgi:hypothetical protein